MISDTAAVFTRKHPPGLYILFSTKMAERFSYYGMRALLIYYMTKGVLLPVNTPALVDYSTIRGVLEWLFGPLSVQAIGHGDGETVDV